MQSALHYAYRERSEDTHIITGRDNAVESAVTPIKSEAAKTCTLSPVGLS